MSLVPGRYLRRVIVRLMTIMVTLWVVIFVLCQLFMPQPNTGDTQAFNKRHNDLYSALQEAGIYISDNKTHLFDFAINDVKQDNIDNFIKAMALKPDGIGEHEMDNSDRNNRVLKVRSEKDNVEKADRVDNIKGMESVVKDKDKAEKAESVDKKEDIDAVVNHEDNDNKDNKEVMDRVVNGGGLEEKEPNKDEKNNEEEMDSLDNKQIEPPGIRDMKLGNMTGPGEMGRALVINKEDLSKEQKADFDDGWQKNAFNRYASDMISLHRSLKDYRNPQCKTIKYDGNLPDACVIIIFHNEAWSVLLRTIHSVLDRSEPKYLKEIILVDDFSDHAHLQATLQDYVDKQDKVTLLRARERSGLIRARIMGFEACTASVAIFLDSHCEATEGWFLPLLARVGEDKTHVVVPVIDTIDDDTFYYNCDPGRPIRAIYMGGFDWRLMFSWHLIPEAEMQRIGNRTYMPIRSPTMAGGLFAISSDFFRHLGTYDEGMDIWGGENLELSFKIWMCGGTLETAPCSHVGHVFRKRMPYTWGSKSGALRKNTMRLAEVWMDDYKQYFYARTGDKKVDYGDISGRLALRERLHCKSFKWYIDNVFPELFVPADALGIGEIRNADRPMCIDASDDNRQREKLVGVYPCHGIGGNQFWMLSPAHEMRRDENCWDTPDGDRILLDNCHSGKGHQEFHYREDNTIYTQSFRKCLELSYDAKLVRLVECSDNRRQKWYMNRKSKKAQPEN